MKRTPVILSAVLLVTLACSVPGLAVQVPATAAPTADTQKTREVLELQQTQTAMASVPTATTQPTATATVTATATPTATATTMGTATTTPTITATAIPCNWAGNVIDVTIEDGTDFAPNATFTKTWQITNKGTCTWTSGYQLVFDSGDRMDSPLAVQLTSGSIGPGGTVNVSVNLKAPADEGRYRGYYRLRAPDGTFFGIGPNANGTFWVEIEVIKPGLTLVPLLPLLPVLPLLKPDLKITAINPCASPKQGVACTIKVSIYNDGAVNVNSNFVTRLYIGSNPSSVCAWSLPSMVAGGGQVAQCNYTFPSWYGSIGLRAVVDEPNSISESDEGNNTTTVNIAVSP